MNLAQQLINGLVLGSGYALIAIGWTVLLGAARLVNFAHGQLYMLAAFLAWAAMERYGVDYYVAVPIAVLALGLLGVVLQGMMLPLVMQQNLTSLMIVTLGFGYVFQGGAARVFGGDPQRLVSPLQTMNIRYGDIWFTVQDAVTLVGTLLLFGLLWLVMNRTRLGALVRSVAEDPKLAQLFGINAARVYIGVFVFECAAGGAGRRPGGAAQPDPDQHGLRRGDPDLRRGGAGRHRQRRRQPARRLRARHVHRPVRRPGVAGLHDGGRLPAAADHAGDAAARPRGAPMTRLATPLALVLAALAYFVPTAAGGTPVIYAACTTIAILAVMAYGADLILSYHGEVSLGHTIFWAAGGYAAAMLSVHLGWNGWMTAGASVGNRAGARLRARLGDPAHARVRVLAG